MIRVEYHEGMWNEYGVFQLREISEPKKKFANNLCKLEANISQTTLSRSYPSFDCRPELHLYGLHFILIKRNLDILIAPIISIIVTNAFELKDLFVTATKSNVTEQYFNQ